LDESTGVVLRAGALTVVGERTVSVCRVGSVPKVYHPGERITLGR
jgi:hypothetical protein